MTALILFALLAQTSAGAQTCQQGVALFEKGDPVAARRALEVAVQETPDAHCWKALGVVLAAMGDYRAATAPFAEACRLDPRERDACYYWARALYSSDRFTDSLRALDRAAPAATPAWRLGAARGQALDALGQGPAAEAALKLALEQRRLDRAPVAEPDPLLALASFLYRQGRSAEALAQLRTAAVGYQKLGAYHYQVGRALAQSEQWNEAVTALSRAVELQPDYPEAHGLLSRCYYRLGNSQLGAAHTAKARPSR